MGAFKDHCVSFDPKGAARAQLEDPPGFDEALVRGEMATAASAAGPAEDGAEAQRRRRALQSRAWNEAVDLKSVFFQVVQLYFVGNTLSVFTILMIWNQLQAPLVGLFSLKKRFHDVYAKEQVDWVMPAAAFAALNLVKLGVVTWKLDKIGLVPKEVADFFSETPVPAVVEFSG